MRALAGFVAGRRTKWLVILGWVVAVIALSPLGAKLSDVTTDDTESFLPAGAESTEVQRLLKDRFPGGETSSGLIVYHRAGGLRPADRVRILRDARAAAHAIPVVRPPIVPFTPRAPEQLVSSRGDTAYTIVTVPTEFRKMGDWGKRLRDVVHHGDGGPQVYVTGDVGLQADFEEVFGSLDTRLLGATVLLVLVLLGAIYRAPLIALIPIIVVALAYQIASGFIYLYAKSGENVNSNSTSILIVLMFGVGTDYCLLLVSRFREELHRTVDRHEAMQRALRRAGPALLASGCTVISAMLVLLLADAGSLKSLGPVSAIGVASVLLAGLTLLPALLTIAGRRGFWPRKRSVECRPEEMVEAPHGLWRRIGDRVLQRPGLVLGVTVAMFGFFSLGLFAYQEDYSIGGFFKKDVESVDGFRVLSQSFPAGALGPTTVLVRSRRGPVTPAEVAAAQRRVRTVPGVAEVTRVLQRSRDGTIARFDLVFRDDPYSDAALDRVDKLRARLRHVAPGADALVGAGTAVQADFNKASQRDLRVIVPVALLVIGVILGILLQAVVAPIVLVATVLVSFFGTLGLSIFFFIEVLGDRGVDASLPTYAFIFLVALGVDYTIFLMSRVREEASRFGTREGVLRALQATGPVITSAGVILAGTFSVLMTLPVSFAFNIGFMVAVGILLDTFVVRTLMVPAAVELLGDTIWWPSTAQGGGRALRESAEPERRAVAEPAGG
jgi:putative drug exporter of the RND superfamily